MLEPGGARTQPEQHPMTSLVSEERGRWRQRRHRPSLKWVSPAGRRVAMAVAERRHGLEVPRAHPRLVDAAVGVELVRMRRSGCDYGRRMRGRLSHLSRRAAPARGQGAGGKSEEYRAS